MTRLGVFFAIGFGLVLLLAGTLYTVDQTEQAIVLQFGEIKRVETKPGVHLKMPFVESVRFFDRRLIGFHAAPTEMITEDKALNIRERVVIDAYVQYRIKDPVQFLKSVGSESGLADRFTPILMSSLRSTVGEVSLRELLSVRRSAIMNDVRDEVNRKASRTVVTTGAEAAKTAADPEAKPADVNPLAATGRGFGIEVVDVRIMRADLPKEISESTFQRMQASFAKEAQRFRSEGEELSLTVRSTADRERAELLAGARKKAEIVRGEADGEAGRIYSEAFRQDAGFYEFYRSLQAYRQSLGKDDTTLVLSPEGGFLKHLEKE